LGIADGIVVNYVVGGFTTPFMACLWGGGLGVVVGVLFVLVRRALWGPDISVDVGTMLGLLYGVVPGLVIVYKEFLVSHVINLWTLAWVGTVYCMLGLVLGGLLDRITDLIVARVKRLQQKRPAE
jgi:hypothetical protein